MIFMYVFKEILILRDYHLSKSIYRLNLSIIDIPILLHTWMIMCVTTKLQMVPYNLYHKSVIINFCFNDLSQKFQNGCVSKWKLIIYYWNSERQKNKLVAIGIRTKYLCSSINKFEYFISKYLFWKKSSTFK